VRRIGCSFCLDARSELVPREGEQQRTRLTKIAAYQAPLLEPGAMDTLALIRAQVERCEAEGIEILCCPEAILGGLADYSEEPTGYAIAACDGRLESALSILSSDIVTTIVGFTELAGDGKLYNAAAVYHQGSVVAAPRQSSLRTARSSLVQDPSARS
jgi:predicted amidohydrolase